jgi:membrane associated rhomboid family serine protease
VTEPLRCYRHPDRETYVSCTECGRGICPDCMTFGPVGIRCPEHASADGAAPAPKRVARRATASLSSEGPIVTQVLIGINVGIFLLQLLMGAGITGSSGWIWEHGSLVVERQFSYGIGGLSEGEWWRLLTAAFLHYGPIHLGMNMLVLWIIGPALEGYFGSAKYLLLYLVSGLAGSAGALIIGSVNHLFDPPPITTTVGASGAIWGIMGAAVLLERRHVYVFGGQAMGLVLLNLIITFAIPGISLGGHIGGLIGGAVTALIFTSLRRRPAVAMLAVAAVGALSVALALSQV